MLGIWRPLAARRTAAATACVALTQKEPHVFDRQEASSSVVGASSPDQEDARSRAEAEAQQGLPDVLPVVDEMSSTRISEEELRQRKSKAVMSWLEHSVGKERVELVRMLQAHHVIVRGGPEEGQRLLNALLDWKRRGLECS